MEDRTENIRRTAEVAKLFAQAGFVVLIFDFTYRSERKKKQEILGRKFLNRFMLRLH